MRYTKQRQSGFILVLTLVLLSIMVIMITQLFNRARIHLYFTQTIIQREKAKQLALSGIQLAMSQLTAEPEEAQEGEAKPENQKPKPNKDLLFLKKNLTIINQWQRFSLKEESDGIEGTIAFYITSEDGKINLNHLFNFTQKKFLNEGQQNDMRKAMITLFDSIKKFANNKNLFESFEKFLKQRQYKLHDVTELLTIEEFQNYFDDAIFPESPSSIKKEQRPVYLTDIFTIWSGQPAANVWLLSDSVRALFSLTRSEPHDSTEQRTKGIEELLKNVTSVSGDLKTVWDTTLQKIYNKEYKALPSDLIPLLTTRFRAKTFGVASYGTVGNITQKLFAIIEAQESMKFMIRKLYWL